MKYLKETIKYNLRSNQFVAKYIEEVNGFYGLAPIELTRVYEERFLNLFKKAYNKSPFYRKIYTGAGIKKEDIQCLMDIRKLPIITKDMIREHPEELLTCAKWLLVKNHTSGTTGTPLTVYESWPALWREQAYNICYRKTCGFEQGKHLIASLRGHLDRKTKFMYVGSSKTLYLSSFLLNEGTVGEYYYMIRKYKPTAIEGYPSSLVHLCSLLKAHNMKCQISIVFTSSETLNPLQRALIENVLSAQVFDHYGNTERTIALSERTDHQGYFEAPGYSINEFEKDRVLTTSLINTAFPLIRYQVDDIITIRNTKGEKVIASIDGRSTVFVTGKDGTRFNAAALTYVAKVIPNIQNVQLVQDEVGKLLVNVVPDRDFDKTCIDRSLRAINEYIGEGNMDITLSIITNQELVYSKSNKLSLIIHRTKC